jgi:hypothetical protein
MEDSWDLGDFVKVLIHGEISTGEIVAIDDDEYITLDNGRMIFYSGYAIITKLSSLEKELF